MRNFHYTIICLLPFLLTSVSGCSFYSETEDDKQALAIPPYKLQNQSGPPETPILEDDREFDMLLPETEICLDQELNALRETGKWLKTNPEHTPEYTVQYDFPVIINKQVQMYLDLFQGKQKKLFSRWLARSGKYHDLIINKLKSAGLPEDLLYLSMIESGFNQRAYSRSRAVGLWQFMKPTGQQYNLQINSYIDERRDFEKSTQAAVTYLTDLYKEFGDWHLAVAAYNGGPGKIRKGLKKYKVDNFWDLAQHRYLKLETKRYVPKLIAAIIIAKEPEKYGFHDIKYQEPLQYENLEVGAGLSLDAVALMTGHKTETIKRLNLELKRGKTPLNRKTHQIKVPAESIALARKNLKRLHATAKTGYKIHIYRTGETVKAISRKYNINTATLTKVNNIISPSALRDGDRLRIPYTTVSYQLLPQGNDKALQSYRNSLVMHTIKKGETLSKISREYNVSTDLIVLWNGLSSVHKIREGQQLALYIQSGSHNQINNKQNNAPLEFNLENNNETIKYYLVKRGDSLWTISRKFNISPNQIKQWNNLKSNLIHPGIRLKIINV